MRKQTQHGAGIGIMRGYNTLLRFDIGKKTFIAA
jgi:hypothetical protein